MFRAPGTFQAAEKSPPRRAEATRSIDVAGSPSSKPPYTERQTLRNLAQIALSEIAVAVEADGEPTKITLKEIAVALDVERSRAESVVRLLLRSKQIARHGTGDGWYAIASWKPKVVEDVVVPGAVQSAKAVETTTSPSAIAEKPSDLAVKVLRLLTDNQHGAVRVTDALLVSTFRASRTAIGKTMRELLDAGRVETVGSGRSACYRLAGVEQVEGGDVVAAEAPKAAKTKRSRKAKASEPKVDRRRRGPERERAFRGRSGHAI